MDSAMAYEKHACNFMRERDESLIGSKVVQNWAHNLPKNTDVIEIACGSGYPISKTLVESGVNLWVIDSSKTLIKEFQLRFPDTPSKCERTQESDYFARKFDAAIAIGFIFLLPEEEQILFIEQISRILPPGGQFLFTAPIELGNWRDLNTGIECNSLGYKKYASALQKAGFSITANFEDVGKNNYYETERI